MSDAEFEEKTERRRRAMFNYSKAMVETIRSYGFVTTLDFLVRISNHDAVVSELLPYFPSIASTAMLEDSGLKLGSKVMAGNADEQVSETDVPKAVMDRRTR